MTRYFSLLALTLVFLAQGQSYVLDPSFGSSGICRTNHAIEPKNGYFENGQYYLFGQERRFARFNYNGAIDYSFGNGGFFVFNPPGETISLVNFKMFQGKCYGFGQTQATNATVNGLIIRLTTSGQLDTTFGANGIVRFDLGANESFNDILISSEGLIYATGTKVTSNDDRVLVCKFLANGSLDTNFNGTGSKILSYNQTIRGNKIFSYENGILLGNLIVNSYSNGDIYLQKLDLNGNLITDFGTNGGRIIPITSSEPYSSSFNDLKLVNNKIYSSFYYSGNVGSENCKLFVFDITAANPVTLMPGIRLYSDSYFEVLDSGKIMISRGLVCPVAGHLPACIPVHFTLKQYNANGTLDTSFDNDGICDFDVVPNPYINTAEGAKYFYRHSDGRIFMAGAHDLFGSYLGMIRIGPAELGMQNSGTKDVFSLFPNPSSKILYINNKENKILENIFISDISGKKIEAVLGHDNGIDISDLSKGMYFLSFTANDNLYTLKFIKS